MTQAELNAYYAEHIAPYVPPNTPDPDAIAAQIYAITGQDVTGDVIGGVVLDFNNAVLGPDVRNNITYLEMLQRAYFGLVNSSSTAAAAAAAASATNAAHAVDGVINTINDALLGMAHESGDANGITFTWTGGTVCHVEGTATAATSNYLYNNTTVLPAGLFPGDKLFVKFKRSGSTSEEDLRLNIRAYNGSGNLIPGFDVYYAHDSQFNIPSSAVGMVIRLYVKSGAVLDEDVTVGLLKHQIESVYSYVAFGGSGTKGAVWVDAETHESDPEKELHFVPADWTIPARIALRTNTFGNYTNSGVSGMGYITKADVGGQQKNLVEYIKSYNFDGVGLVTVMAGANDKQVHPLGDRNSTANDGTVCGALKEIISYMDDNYPKIQLVIVSPTPCGVVPGNNVWKSPGAAGWSHDDMDREFGAICNANGIIYIDWHGCQLCENWDFVGYNGSTGPNYTHPTYDDAYLQLGEFIGGRVAAMIGRAAEAEDEPAAEGYVSTPDISEGNNPYVLTDTANAPFHAFAISNAVPGEMLTVCGKNIWNMHGYQIMSEGQRIWNIKQNGVQFIFNPTAGTVRIRTTGFDGASPDGKASATAVSASSALGSDYARVNENEFYHNFKFKFSTDTVVSISDNCSVEPPFNFGVQLRIDDALSENSAKYGVGTGMVVFKAVAGREYGCRFRVEKGWSGDITFRPQVEINSHPTAFEPYIGTTVGAYVTSGAGNIFAVALNPGHQHDDDNEIDAVFTAKSITVKCEAVASGNRVVYAPNRDPHINGHDFLYVARFEGLSGPVYVGGIPKKYKGLVRGQISDGVHSWYDDGDGVVFNAEYGLDYAYRLVCTPSAVIDDAFVPVILKEADALVMIRSVTGTTTIMTDGSATIAATAVKETASETADFAGVVAKRIDEITAGRLRSPVGNAVRRPMISFIDDDTSSDDLIVAYHDLCESLGIVGGYAIETDSVDASEGALEHLLEYEDEGFSMHYHCKEQKSTGEDNTWYWIDGDKEEGQAAYDEDKIRENFVGGLRAISNYGLLNYKRWVTPYGVNNEYVKQLAKEYGLECLISFSYGNHWQMAHISRKGNAGKWDIPRVYWDKNVTAARLMSLVQACIADNGWMIVTTHVNSWGTIGSTEWEASAGAFESFVEYCIDEGMEVVPFGVGFETMKPALDMHDLLEL